MDSSPTSGLDTSLRQGFPRSDGLPRGARSEMAKKPSTARPFFRLWGRLPRYRGGPMRSRRPFSSHESPDPEGNPVAAERRRIEAAEAGDRAAQEELLRVHYARVHATAFRLVGNPEDAEDLAQE